LANFFTKNKAKLCEHWFLIKSQFFRRKLATIDQSELLLLQVKVRMNEDAAEKAEKSVEDEANAIASMRLAYQDLSIEKKKQVRSTKFFFFLFCGLPQAPRSGQAFKMAPDD
jgi:hypothetical protein